MWFILALIGGAAAVAVATSSESSAPVPRDAKDPFFGNSLDVILHNAEKFREAITTSAASKDMPDWAVLAQAAQARKAKEEADTRRMINETFDKYRDNLSMAAAATGIGVVAVPFIIIGATLGKWAANAQITLFKTLGIATDGWSDTWVSNVEGEIRWLADRRIPFPGWNDGKGWNSPMGYVNGGGGSECGSGGLCAIREAYGKYPNPLDMASGFRAWQTMSRHLRDNALVFAFYSKIGAEFEGGHNITVGGNATVEKLFVAALASAVCQDRGVPFVRWDSVIRTTHAEWMRLRAAYEKAGHNNPFADSVGSTHDYAIAMANKEVVAAGNVLALYLPKF